MADSGEVILFSDQTYLPDRLGGRESSIHDLTRLLRGRGWRPRVVARQGRWRDRLRRSWQQLEWRDYPVLRLPDPVAGLSRWMSAGQPPLVIASVANTSVAKVIAAVEPSRLVVYIRDCDDIEQLADLPLRDRPRFLANSAFVAGRLRDAAGIEADVIPPLIDGDRYRVDSPGRCVTFINLYEKKGLEIALGLASLRPAYAFLFVESWRLTEERWRRIEATCAPSGNVRLQRGTPKMDRVYRQTRLLLAPSQWEEAWGRVVTEAQFSGIPALASRIGGLPESVGVGGVLLEPDAPIEAWAHELDRLLEPDRWREMSASARTQAEHYRRQAENGLARLDELLTTMSGVSPAAMPYVAPTTGPQRT